MVELPDKICFHAVILKHPGIDAGYIEFPFDVLKLFGKKGQVKVNVLFDKTAEYRGSLAKMGQGCHVLGITREIRQKINKSFGESIEVELEPDLAVREVTVPADLAYLFSNNPEMQSNFEE